MTLLDIARKQEDRDRDEDDVPDFPLYRQAEKPLPVSVDKKYSDPADDPEVLRVWGGQRVQCVALSATAAVILALLVPINERFVPDVLRKADDLWLDKLIHMAMFALLTGIYCCVFLPFCRTATRTFEYLSGGRFFLIVGSVAVLAVITEYLQPFFGRTFDYVDMAVDILAVVPGFGIFIVLNELRHKLVSRRTN